MVKTLVDAGPIIALWNRRDRYHAWSVETFGTLRPPLFTTEPVITEASYFILQSGKSARPLLDQIASGLFQIPLLLAEQTSSLASLMEKYSGRMDLADATLVRLSELLEDSQVLTTDHEAFSVYRRHGRQVIPLLMPPR